MYQFTSGMRTESGVTLLELALVLALVGILASIAVPAYTSTIEKLRVKQASTDLMGIMLIIGKHRSPAGVVPDSLAGIRGVPAADPWGRPYIYNSFSTPGFNRGAARKDRNLVPINTEFDLYSAGKDGESRAPLTAWPSRDDVVVARDGSFIGLARDF
jgi:general secretion pathway protein G